MALLQHHLSFLCLGIFIPADYLTTLCFCCLVWDRSTAAPGQLWKTASRPTELLFAACSTDLLTSIGNWHRIHDIYGHFSSAFWKVGWNRARPPLLLIWKSNWIALHPESVLARRNRIRLNPCPAHTCGIDFVGAIPGPTHLASYLTEFAVSLTGPSLCQKLKFLIYFLIKSFIVVLHTLIKIILAFICFWWFQVISLLSGATIYPSSSVRNSCKQ